MSIFNMGDRVEVIGYIHTGKTGTITSSADSAGSWNVALDDVTLVQFKDKELKLLSRTPDEPIEGIAIQDIEHSTLHSLLNAMRALGAAQQNTNHGLASDEMENAARYIRKAMRYVGG